MVTISLVVAVADNGVIGRDGDMPWRLSTDLKRFRTITDGGVLLMGRKTFEAIGRPLPGRETVVVTRDGGWSHDGVRTASTIEAGLARAGELAAGRDGCVHIVGGGTIYAQTTDRADVLHVTHIHAEPEGDTRFGPIDPSVFERVSAEAVPAGPADSAPTTYATYRRRGAA